ncbi:MAG: hypothetical protein IT324_17580 [Anaerolineae bacterium]|nr:hypothetical protein [Anaerolineae bacterium]
MTTFYVFVTGSNGAGKSQFLYALGDPDGYLLDEETGLEYRDLVVDDTLDVVLFCAQDGTRFDQLLQIPQDDLLGYIILVDSAAPDKWGEARIMIDNCRGYALKSTVIAANKQDMAGAHTAEQVGAWIGMGNMMRVCPVVATDPDSARNVVLQLLYSVEHEIERLDALIAEIERLMGDSTPT